MNDCQMQKYKKPKTQMISNTRNIASGIDFSVLFPLEPINVLQASNNNRQH